MGEVGTPGGHAQEGRLVEHRAVRFDADEIVGEAATIPLDVAGERRLHVLLVQLPELLFAGHCLSSLRNSPSAETGALTIVRRLTAQGLLLHVVDRPPDPAAVASSMSP